jgi:hypothetical protein
LNELTSVLCILGAVRIFAVASCVARNNEKSNAAIQMPLALFLALAYLGVPHWLFIFFPVSMERGTAYATLVKCPKSAVFEHCQLT